MLQTHKVDNAESSLLAESISLFYKHSSHISNLKCSKYKNNGFFRMAMMFSTNDYTNYTFLNCKHLQMHHEPSMNDCGTGQSCLVPFVYSAYKTGNTSGIKW